MKLLIAGVLGAIVLLSACGSPSAGHDPGVLHELRLDSASARLHVGDTLRMTARAYSPNEQEIPAQIEWTTLDSMVASVSASGTVRARGVGATFAVARASHGLNRAADSALVTVLPSHTAEQAILIVIPSEVSLGAVGTLTLTAYAAGAARGTYSWSVTDSSIVRLRSQTVISDRLAEAEIEALAAGHTQVRVQSTSGFSATANVRVP
jgi:uncharacterized protein YjdB